jgi:hypothetical protein
VIDHERVEHLRLRLRHSTTQTAPEEATSREQAPVSDESATPPGETAPANATTKIRETPNEPEGQTTRRTGNASVSAAESNNGSDETTARAGGPQSDTGGRHAVGNVTNPRLGHRHQEQDRERSDDQSWQYSGRDK